MAELTTSALFEAFAGHDGKTCGWAVVSEDGKLSAKCNKPKDHDGPHGNDKYEWSVE